MRITPHSYLRLGAQALPSNPQEETRQDSPARSARVRTTRIGFNLGKLGIEYTSRDLRFDPEESSSKKQTKDRMAAVEFADAMHAETTRRRMLDGLARNAADPQPQPAAPAETAPSRRRGLMAYAASMAQSLDPAPRTLLATA